MILARTLFSAALAVGPLSLAHAQAPVKIGFVSTLSGPAGYLGQDIRDAFLLAMEREGGNRLGGVPVQLVVEDDGLKPGAAKQIVDRFLKTERIRVVTGVVFSHLAVSIVPDVVDTGALFLSPNAGPSNFAGKECHKNYFVYSWQNDALHESAGALANNLGYKNAFVLAANYQAGKDAVAGFKRLFKGKIVEEVYTKLDQTDFAAEMARIRAAKPDVVYQFHPGGTGIAFLKQYAQAGLNAQIPMVGAEPMLDVATLRAVGDTALGLNVGVKWNTDFDNPESRDFVAAFQKKYNRVPSYYAGQGWDTAQALAAALRVVGSDNPDKLAAELRKANFKSIRGPFRFGPNQHPVQDWYQVQPVKNADGSLSLKTVGKILAGHGDAFSKDCKL
ncbi:MAG: ABC transporter substrate-binding protein [Gammaproteobacteria bacterium]|nr:ABC transporter substrate-binding protein [Gammaproteobacteria bacterium]